MTTATGTATASSHSSPSTFPHYTPDLLVLQQSDLKRGKNSLVLLGQVPLEAVCSGEASIVASSRQASLITPSKSYALTTLGTSNTLCLFQNRNKSSESHKTQDHNKRQKIGIQSCRLLQPGGQGAKYWMGKEVALTEENLRTALNNPSNKNLNLAQLALQLQCSETQVTTALSRVADCVVLPKTGTIQTLSEDEQWQARLAVVQTACEEDGLANNTMVWKEAVNQVSQRLPLAQHVRQAVAAKHLEMVCEETDAKKCFANGDKIVLWVLQDMLRTKTTWSLDDCLTTLQSRLPMSYGEWLSLAWLQQTANHELGPAVHVTDDQVSWDTTLQY